MDQIQSALDRSSRPAPGDRSRPSTSRPEQTSGPADQAGSTLLQQPVDVILEIACHLDRASNAALSLSCKTMSAVLAIPSFRLPNTADREAFLQLLEKEQIAGGNNAFFYCHICTHLHRYKSWWGPGNTRFEKFMLCRPYDSSLTFYLSSPPGWFGQFYYRHARLVMNRYFHGHGGLPLDNLAFHGRRHRMAPREMTVVESARARIVGDELFLRRELKVAPPVHRFRRPPSPQQFRKDLDDSEIRVCNHLTLSFRKTSSHVLGVSPPQIPEIAAISPTEPFVPCRGVRRSCRLCPTDYDTTIERTKTRGSERGGSAGLLPKEKGKGGAATHWTVTVVCYYGLGSCRKPWGPDYWGSLVTERDELTGYFRDQWMST